MISAEMVDGLISDEYVKAGVPLHRAGTIDDMGGLILFLASRVRALNRMHFALETDCDDRRLVPILMELCN